MLSQHTKKNANIYITVVDSGTGIAQEDSARVFERFYQTDKSRKGDRTHGSGLGFSIAKEIVAAHGGQLWIENNEPRGSVFVVKIRGGDI